MMAMTHSPDWLSRTQRRKGGGALRDLPAHLSAVQN